MSDQQEAGRPMTTKEALAMFRQAVRSPANSWLEKQLERDPDYVCTCGCCWVCAYRYIEKHLPQ